MANLSTTALQAALYDAIMNGCDCSLGAGYIAAAGQGARADARVVLGQDIDAITGPGTSLFMVSGLLNIGKAIARRLSTPRGALVYAPDYGLDMRSYVNAGVIPDRLSDVKAQILAEVRKDPRIQDARVDVTVNYATSAFTVKILLETAIGPFDLYLFVTQLSVDILDQAA